MLNFTNSPTVGSHDSTLLNDELRQRIATLEDENKRLKHKLEADEQQKSPKKKITFGKIKKFFKNVITPILNFIPRFFNALARFKGVRA